MGYQIQFFYNSKSTVNQNKITMSLNWQQSRIHALNNSSSKPTFGFPKSPRFRSTSRPLCDTFYNISKNIMSSKGAGIGRGNKTTFCDKNGFPSPLQYDIKSTFDPRNKSSKGVRLSLGRQNIKYGGIFNKSETPDPSHYTPKDPRINSPKSGYSMRPKIKEQEMSYMKNPGPGQYNSHSTISATGIYTLSNFSNCKCPKIKPTKQYNPALKQITPGPGQYDRHKENLNGKGHYFVSKYADSRARSFSKSSCDQTQNRARMALPGPGSYNYFSEFGAKLKIL